VPDEAATQALSVDFNVFVVENRRTFLRIAYLLCGNWADAEDLVQASFLMLWRRWHTAQIEIPQAYMRRILYNTFISSGRRATLRRTSQQRYAQRATAAVLESGRDPELLTAIRGLPERQRAVVVLRHFEDLSERQVAEVLGCSIGTVKSQNSRALRRLKEKLQTEWKWEE
jgi:RNA polymerase sigma-70 factor (sigma-E family)